MIKKKEKTCFIIMPISDTEGYAKGHFKRVYEHIIKPACKNAGFIPIRADDEVKTNFIVIDIIKKILESEMVICDLSSKNPNVFYELGIRQSFNKKTVLIKDKKTGRVFDIQGLRAIDYDESLRIDSVQKNIKEISTTLIETYKSNENEINSLIQLLSIKPAKISDSFELSSESSLILKAINNIQDQINEINNSSQYGFYENITKKFDKYVIDEKEFFIGFHIYENKKEIGELVGIQNGNLLIRDSNNRNIIISSSSPRIENIQCLPF